MTKENKELCGKMTAVANSYKDSAELLNVANQLITGLASKQGIHAPNGDSLEFNRVILSMLLLYSLDIEILLKAIFLADNDTLIKGHDWSDIFKNLSSERQKEIIGKMDDVFQADFHKLMDDNKKTFIEWRYSYEKDNLHSDFSFVKNLTNVLVGIIMPLVN